jgi:hypothetical protein
MEGSDRGLTEGIIQHLPRGMRETTKTAIVIAGLRAEI